MKEGQESIPGLPKSYQIEKLLHGYKILFRFQEEAEGMVRKYWEQIPTAKAIVEKENFDPTHEWTIGGGGRTMFLPLTKQETTDGWVCTVVVNGNSQPMNARSIAALEATGYLTKKEDF